MEVFILILNGNEFFTIFTGAKNSIVDSLKSKLFF